MNLHWYTGGDSWRARVVIHFPFPLGILLSHNTINKINTNAMAMAMLATISMVQRKLPT